MKDSEETLAYLFDLDGTLADNQHRQHFLQREPRDWQGFFDACLDDAPIEYVIQLCNDLWWGSHEHEIIIVTGRPESHREMTEDWLREHAVSHDQLLMRRTGDYRGDHIVKAELLAQVRQHGLRPVLAIDDRPTVIEMWQREGVPVLIVPNPLWSE